MRIDDFSPKFTNDVTSFLSQLRAEPLPKGLVTAATAQKKTYTEALPAERNRIMNQLLAESKARNEIPAITPLVIGHLQKLLHG